MKTQKKQQPTHLLDLNKIVGERRVVNKFFSNLETRKGTVNGKQIEFVLNEKQPELSYILVGQL